MVKGFISLPRQLSGCCAPPKRDRWDNHSREIHNRNQGRESIADGFGIRSPAKQGNRAVPSSLGIHSPEDRSKRGVPSNPDIHSPAARSPDTRKQEARRLGSRNKCPVAEVVYLRLPQISRLRLQSLLLGPLPARHPPLLQWPHQKLPIRLRQGRVEPDHMGWCRLKGPTLARQSVLGFAQNRVPAQK
jgi:hypothetical protein